MSKDQAVNEAVIDQLAQDVHETAVLKEFWQPPDTFLAEINTKLLLIISEVVKAQEVLRAHYRGKANPYSKMTEEQLAKFLEELADVIIRTLDLARYFGTGIGEIIITKMARNQDRQPLNGRRF